MNKAGNCIRTAVLSLSLILITTVSMFGQSANNLKTHIDTVSYSIGVNIAKNLMQGGIMVNPEALKAGIIDAMKDAQLISDDDIMNAMMMLNQEMQLNMEMKAQQKGAKFLEENKKKTGVKVTASGLQYEVVSGGKGKKPSLTNVVKVHYTGKLLDGTVFDSSVDRGEPIEFPLNRVIMGWQEGLQLMSEGSKFILYVPYDLAYGEQGAPPSIGPYETLIFEVELLEVLPGENNGN